MPWTAQKCRKEPNCRWSWWLWSHLPCEQSCSWCSLSSSHLTDLEQKLTQLLLPCFSLTDDLKNIRALGEQTSRHFSKYCVLKKRALSSVKRPVQSEQDFFSVIQQSISFWKHIWNPEQHHVTFWCFYGTIPSHTNFLAEGKECADKLWGDFVYFFSSRHLYFFSLSLCIVYIHTLNQKLSSI